MRVILTILVIVSIAIPVRLDNLFFTPLHWLEYDTSPQVIERAAQYLEDKYELVDFVKTMRGESNFRYNAKNPTSSAFGVCQFMPDTWKQYCDGDYASPRDQLVCAAKMWQNGLQRHWEYYTMYLAKN
jgi:hypothetical protein